MPKKITQNVNKDKIFNDLPKVDPGKSKWFTRWSNYQNSNLGQIVPVYYDEILPGEKRKVTMGMISHTTTPVAPIFNSLYTEFRAFWIPMRLCADLLNGYKTRKSPWVKVFGEDNANNNASVIVPLADQKLPDISNAFITYLLSTSSYMHETSVFDSLDLSNLSTPYLKKCNFLTLAAYELVYQRHYRNENYEAATASGLYRALFDAYNNSKSYLGITINDFEISNREKDYFTGMKPFTLKNTSPIRVGLAGLAQVKVDNFLMHDMGGAIKLAPNTGSLMGGSTLGIKSNGTDVASNNPSSVSSTYDNDIRKSNLIADLTTASGISIEELRLLVKTQELLEKDAIYGSLYAESLNAHFGCCPLDTTLQDPQELFKVTITSQMQAIFQTSTTNGESTILGTIGANSTTQTDPFVIVPETKFEEHGILMICAVHKLQNVYDAKQWKNKFIYKKARFDFYTPELNDLGYQPVTDEEFNTSLSPVAGYNEAFAEYRYKFNKVHGVLADDFAYWVPSIRKEYRSASALYKEDSAILDKALSVTSDDAPQFYDAFGFEEINEKPMSLHSIPGMDGVI